MKNKLKKFFVYAMAIIMALAVLISFIPAIGQKTADVINYPVESVVNVAKTVVFVTVGLFLIYAGALSIAAPIIGGALILTGAIMLFYALKPLIFKKSSIDD